MHVNHRKIRERKSFAKVETSDKIDLVNLNSDNDHRFFKSKKQQRKSVTKEY